MGDVFDAMNRSNKEQGKDRPKPTESQAPDTFASAEPKGPEQGGGLPLDDVKATPLGRDREEAAASRYEDESREAKAKPAAMPAAAPSRQPTVAAAAERKAAEDADSDRNDSSGRPTTGTSVSDAFDRNNKDRIAAAEKAQDPEAAAAKAKLNGYALQVVVHHDRGSVVTEQYRAIRTQILARNRTRRMQTYVVTSSTPEEGKSVTAINLGVAFSELRNQRSVLIEGDLRRPAFEKLFDRRCDRGLMQMLRGEIDDIDQVIHPTVYDNLQFIPAGGRDPNHATELLSSPRMSMLLDRLKDRYDYIFIDSPPVITVSDAFTIGQNCDSTLLVVRLNKTSSDVVERAKRLLRANGCEVTGVILTHMKHQMPRYLYRYDRYGANYR